MMFKLHESILNYDVTSNKNKMNKDDKIILKQIKIYLTKILEN
jgi:hypothetical protein